MVCISCQRWELAEHDLVRPEGVRFDSVAADGQEPGVDLADHVRAGLAEDLGAVLVAGVVGQGQVVGEDAGAHGPVEDQDPPLKSFEELRCHVLLSVESAGRPGQLLSERSGRTAPAWQGPADRGHTIISVEGAGMLA